MTVPVGSFLDEDGGIPQAAGVLVEVFLRNVKGFV